MGDLLFEAKGVGKTYGANTVLRDIDMQVYSGEVIGLIGENGAGKSTLMKLISGVEKPSMGEMFRMGKPYSASSILDANHQGIGMVFQEQSLVGNLTIAQNIYLGREKGYSKCGFVNWNKMNQDAKKALGRIDMDLDPSRKVRDIDFAARQMVEIAKVLDVVTEAANGHAIILLDEPTTVLSDEEIKKLFVQVRNMKEQGNAVIFISHRLDEVLEITDRIYVFKDGEETAVMPTKGADVNLLYEKMVGRTTTGEFYVEHKQTVPTDEVILEVNDLSLFGAFNHVSFELKKGEVLGFCGVEGSGKEDICAVLVGDAAPTAGTIKVKGRECTFPNPCAARKKGILSVPKERRDEGMIGLLSIEDNIIVSHMDELSSHSFLSAKKMHQVAENWVKKAGCEILILNHPTRGVDVGSKEEIYDLVRDMTAEGHSIILLGDTLDECIGLSSRIIVLRDGLIRGSFECPVGNKPLQLDIVQQMM